MNGIALNRPSNHLMFRTDGFQVFRCSRPSRGGDKSLYSCVPRTSTDSTNNDLLRNSNRSERAESDVLKGTFKHMALSIGERTQFLAVEMSVAPEPLRWNRYFDGPDLTCNACRGGGGKVRGTT